MFKKNGSFYLGTVSEIRLGAKNNKDKRCIYNDDDKKYLSLNQLSILSRLYPLPKKIKEPDTNVNQNDHISDTSSVDINNLSDFVDENIKSINTFISFISQNIHSLKSEFQSVKLDAIVNIISSRNIDVYCIQETWLDGNFMKEINGYMIFHYGLTLNKFVIEVRKV